MGKLLTPSSHQPVQMTNHSDFHSKMSTKLVVSEQSQSVVSKLVSSSQVWLSPLPLSWSPLKLSLLRCITNLSQKLDQVTMLVSTSKTCLKDIRRGNVASDSKNDPAKEA